MELKSQDLASHFVVLSPDQAATPVAFTPTVFEELDRNFDGFKGHILVAIFDFESDWPTREVHPAGDEIVMLLSGEATMVLFSEGGEETVTLSQPGSYVLVPKGTWHTARVPTPTRMLFITPGEGTENVEL